jgi:hypothetical protein
MPSKSEAQKRFFAAAAANPDFAKKAGIKPSDAKEWHEADKKKPNAKLPEKVKSTNEAIYHQWSKKKT